MAIVKGEFRPPVYGDGGAVSYPNEVHLKTSANMVVYDNTITGLYSTTAQGAIDELKVAVSSAATPETFGAVGDGIADDTAALQAAIDAACGYNAINLAEGVGTTQGYLKPDGTTDISGDWRTYDKIAVTPKGRYSLTNISYSSMAHVCLYDGAGRITRTFVQYSVPSVLVIDDGEVEIRFSTEAVSDPVFKDITVYGMPLQLGRRTYRVTDRLIVRESITIQGASGDGSIIFFDGPEPSEEIDYDLENYWNSHAVIVLKADYCKLSNFTITNFAATSAGACNWHGIICHFVGNEGDAYYLGSARHTFERIIINGFKSGVFIYAGWNRYFINCGITNCSTAGIEYKAIDGYNWSASGDIFQSCQIIGCTKGMLMVKAFETTMQNCVFEYCTNAIHTVACVDALFMSCWNEANSGNILVDGVARFIGGYNINENTVTHINTYGGDGFAWIELATETLGIRGDDIIFMQKGGIITKGVSIGSSQINFIENPTFGTIAVPNGEPWMWEAHNVHTFLDPTMSLNGNNSALIDCSMGEWEIQPGYGVQSSHMLVDPNTDYKFTIWLRRDASKDADLGAFMGVHYFNSEGEYIGNVAVKSNIIPIAAGTWEKQTLEFNSQGATRINLKVGLHRRGRMWFNAPVLTTADISVDKLEIRKTEDTGVLNIVDNVGVVLSTIYDNSHPVVDSVTGTAYTWKLTIANGIPSIQLTEVVA